MQTETVIPVASEDLILEKRREVKNCVQVAVVTHRCTELLDEALASESVQVERVPINKIISEIPKVREEEDTVIVPVVEEVLVVEHRLLLKEEVRVRRVRELKRYQEYVDIRKQEGIVRLTKTKIAAKNAAADLENK